MGKDLSRRQFLKSALAGSALTAASVLIPGGADLVYAQDEGTYIPGTYTAKAAGFSGDVIVTLTFSADAITDAVIDVSAETPTVGGMYAEEFKQAVLEAQSAEIDGISGATFTSGAVKEAVGKCIAQAKGEIPVEVIEAPAEAVSWRTPPAPIPDEEIAETFEADVIVLGAGHSGCSCARAAAENGASVILVEKAAEDAYYVFGSEYGGINSKYMTEELGYEPVDRAACYTDWMARNAWRCNSSFVRTYVDRSGETFDWMLEVLDPEFIAAFSTNGLPGPSRYSGCQNQQLTWASSIEMNDSTTVQRASIAKMLSCGETNKMLWETSLEQLVKEGDRVVAAIVKRADGTYARLNASVGVVVATGGFCANAEMCHDIFWNLVNKYPKDMQDTVDVSYPMAPRNGDGHKACVWAGAAWEPNEPASMSWSNPSGFNPFNNAKFAFSNLWLDGSGNRFVNEGGDFQLSGIQGQFLQMKDGRIRVYSIFDSSLLEDLQYQQAGHATHAINDSGTGAARVEEIKAGMQAAIDAGDEGYVTPWLQLNSAFNPSSPVFAGDSPQQLADRLGMDGEVRDNFIRSIERYNALCEAGYDEDFFKDADLMLPLTDYPLFGFYMDYSLTVGLTTLSGIWTDDQQCCLDEQHQPIPGLYATGNVSGRRWIGQYSTSIAGQSVALANTLGRALGEHLGTLIKR